jgi:acyl dehydratase
VYFDELTQGQVIETASHVVTTEEMLSFATAYDPQPIHMDPDGAPQGAFDRPIASGFQTMSIAWRLWVDAVMQEQGRAGITLTDGTFHRPVFAGTELRARVRIEEHRVTARGHGLITMGFEVFGDDELVLTFRTTGLLGRAPASATASATESR